MTSVCENDQCVVDYAWGAETIPTLIPLLHYFVLQGGGGSDKQSWTPSWSLQILLHRRRGEWPNCPWHGSKVLVLCKYCARKYFREVSAAGKGAPLVVKGGQNTSHLSTQPAMCQSTQCQHVGLHSTQRQHVCRTSQYTVSTCRAWEKTALICRPSHSTQRQHVGRHNIHCQHVGRERTQRWHVDRLIVHSVNM